MPDDFASVHDLDDDDPGDAASAPVRPKWGAELYEACETVRAKMLPEWGPEADDTVELVPDGQAVLDGAFTASELMRVAEAINEAARLCSPHTGVAAPPGTPPPQPLMALHVVRHILRVAPGTPGHPELEECERGFWVLAATVAKTNELLRCTDADLAREVGRVAAARLALEAYRKVTHSQDATTETVRSMFSDLETALGTNAAPH